MKQWLFGGEGGGSALADLGLMLLRGFAGFGLMTHGIKKFPPPEGFVQIVEKLGFPAPRAFALAAGCAEFGGGALLSLGLLTRPASLLIFTTMMVAAFGEHRKDSFKDREASLTYGFVALAFLLSGSGRYGLDAPIAGAEADSSASPDESNA